MKEPGSSMNTGNKKRYELNAVDVRFLSIVDQVIKANTKAGVKPNTDRGISEKIFGRPDVIGKMRISDRGITISQVRNFGLYFGIDYNCFFREDFPVTYHPSNMGWEPTEVTFPEPGSRIKAGKKSVVTQFNGSNYGEVIGQVQGDVYKGNSIDQIIQQAEQIVNNHFTDPEQKKQHHELLNSLQQETRQLETVLIEKHEAIKKMADVYESQLLSEKEKRAEAEKKLSQVQEEERNILKKYSALLEQLNGLKS